METETPRRCLDCERLLILEATWRAMTPVEVATAKHTGRAKHCARGLCNGCYVRHKAHGTLDNYARSTTPAEVALAEWEWLHEAGELRRSDVLADRIRQAAPRIGMSPEALEAALQRAARRAA